MLNVEILNNILMVLHIQELDPLLSYCWASVADGGPTLIRHRFDVLLMLG